MMKKEHTIFTMIKKFDINELTISEGYLYLFIIQQLNRQNWKPVKFKTEDLPLDTRVVRKNLVSLQDKGLLSFKEEGSKNNLIFVISYASNATACTSNATACTSNATACTSNATAESLISMADNNLGQPNTYLNTSLNTPLNTIKNTYQVPNTLDARDDTANYSSEISNQDYSNLDIASVTSDASKIIIEEQTNASSREQQDPQQHDTQSRDMSKLEVYTTRINDIPHYEAKLKYRKFNIEENKLNDTYLFTTFKIKCMDIPNLEIVNLASKLNNFKLKINPIFFQEKKILIDSISVKLSDNEFSKFYS